MMRRISAALLAIVGAIAIGAVALQRHEPINALWILTAAVCVYLLGYRFYAAWIAARVLSVDASRATPAERLNNGRDFVPTHRAIVFGHHFAAIAGPGPLVGPTLAAQFGYLPGTLWILVGAVLGGCVQDMIILLLSTRRDGRSLGQMARDELGPLGGFAALIGTLIIMIILSAVLGLVIVNVMKHSPWATSTVFATIPAALIVGLYLRLWRPGRVLEGSLLGVMLMVLALLAGGWIDHQPVLRPLFDYAAIALAGFVIVYGFCAAILPVWLLLAPRDYLSTFLKLGTVALLAVAIVLTHPQIKMPAVTAFTDGTGPLFGGNTFGKGLLALWYHFAIMFEAVFIMAVLDAGTRVGRFMLQDLLGHLWQPLGRTSWYPSVLLASALMVGAWGYFLYIGVIDPNGGVNILWPLFGISNQMLAGIALSVATGIIIKSGKLRYALVTLAPLAWLALVTTTAAWQKITSSDARIGLFAAADDLARKLALGALPPERAAVAPQLIFNQRLDGWLTMLLLAILWFVIPDMARVCVRRLRGLSLRSSSEAPYQPSRLPSAAAPAQP